MEIWVSYNMYIGRLLQMFCVIIDTVGLSTFRALGTKYLRAPLSLADPRRGS